MELPMDTVTANAQSQSDARVMYKRAPQCISADLAGEAVILNPESGVYFSLNEVAALIWNEMETAKTAQDLYSVIMEGYDVESQKCKVDVLRILDDLVKHNLVTVQSHGDA